MWTSSMRTSKQAEQMFRRNKTVQIRRGGILGTSHHYSGFLDDTYRQRVDDGPMPEAVSSIEKAAAAISDIAPSYQLG